MNSFFDRYRVICHVRMSVHSVLETRTPQTLKTLTLMHIIMSILCSFFCRHNRHKDFRRPRCYSSGHKFLVECVEVQLIKYNYKICCTAAFRLVCFIYILYKNSSWEEKNFLLNVWNITCTITISSSLMCIRGRFHIWFSELNSKTKVMCTPRSEHWHISCTKF